MLKPRAQRILDAIRIEIEEHDRKGAIDDSLDEINFNIRIDPRTRDVHKVQTRISHETLVAKR